MGKFLVHVLFPTSARTLLGGRMLNIASHHAKLWLSTLSHIEDHLFLKIKRQTLQDSKTCWDPESLRQSMDIRCQASKQICSTRKEMFNYTIMLGELSICSAHPRAWWWLDLVGGHLNKVACHLWNLLCKLCLRKSSQNWWVNFELQLQQCYRNGDDIMRQRTLNKST